MAAASGATPCSPNSTPPRDWSNHPSTSDHGQILVPLPTTPRGPGSRHGHACRPPGAGQTPWYGRRGGRCRSPTRGPGRHAEAQRSAPPWPRAQRAGRQRAQGPGTHLCPYRCDAARLGERRFGQRSRDSATPAPIGALEDDAHFVGARHLAVSGAQATIGPCWQLPTLVSSEQTAARPGPVRPHSTAQVPSVALRLCCKNLSGLPTPHAVAPNGGVLNCPRS